MATQYPSFNDREFDLLKKITDNTAVIANNGGGGGGGAVASVSAGSGISVNQTTGAVVVTNTGVRSAVAGTGISVNAATGTVTFTNTGVTSNVAGTGISVSGATGAVTITNSGVTSAVAGTGISVSGATGAVTITNSGVTSITGTANQVVASAATGGVTLSVGTALASFPGITGIPYFNSTSAGAAATKAQVQALLGNPTSSVDNAAVRFDGITGSIQDSSILISDASANNVTLSGIDANTDLTLRGGLAGATIALGRGATGGVTVTAQGTNQSITIVPSGTGRLNITGATTNANYTGINMTAAITGAAALFNVTNSVASGSAQFSATNSSGDTTVIGCFGSGSSGFGALPSGRTGILFAGNGVDALTIMQYGGAGYINFGTGSNGLERCRITNAGNILIATTTDGTGRLQFAAATTAAGGMTFGTDWNLYRSSSSVFTASATGGTAGFVISGTASAGSAAIGLAASAQVFSFGCGGATNGLTTIRSKFYIYDDTNNRLMVAADSVNGWTFINTNTATSGTIDAFSITPTYNQASGTAANTDLLINRTQTAVGSGAQLLIDAQVATTSKFKVDNTGVLTITGTLNTAAPTGGAGAWKLGIANAVSPTSPNRTITIDIGGTTYYLAAKTTND